MEKKSKDLTSIKILLYTKDSINKDKRQHRMEKYDSNKKDFVQIPKF